MVTVIFYHLLRSKYNIKQIEVEPGTINNIILQIKEKHPVIDLDDFRFCVVFVNDNKVVHPSNFDTMIYDGDKVVFTHFVGGG
jgi:molybdopterin converting factor small subunit